MTAPARSSGRLRVLLLLAAVPAVGLAARLVSRLEIPLCAFRGLTGLPCPFCGGTRVVAALSRLEFAQSLALNPLVFLMSWAALIWLVVLLVGRGSGSLVWPPSAVAGTGFTALSTRYERLALLVVLANWAYVLATMPRVPPVWRSAFTNPTAARPSSAAPGP